MEKHRAIFTAAFLLSCASASDVGSSDTAVTSHCQNTLPAHVSFCVGGHGAGGVYFKNAHH